MTPCLFNLYEVGAVIDARTFGKRAQMMGEMERNGIRFKSLLIIQYWQQIRKSKWRD